MNVTIKPVLIDDKQRLSDMLDSYIDELSKYADEKFIKPYKHLDKYFSEPNRLPFFIVVDTTRIGFALVNLKDPLSDGTKQAISEFFVVEEFRGRGVGTRAAIEIFNQYPGTWMIREVTGNPAIFFWKKLIDKYTHGDYQEYEQNDEIQNRTVQEFSNLK